LGQGSGGNAFSGSSNTGFGVNTLHALTSGANNLALGCSAGQKLSSGSSNLFLGDYAGYQQLTASNLFLVSNQNTYQTSGVNEIAYSLMSGTFATSQGTTTGNTLNINGQTTITPGIASTSATTGSLIVNGGLGLQGSIYMTGSVYGANWNGGVISQNLGGAGTVNNGILKATIAGVVSTASAGTDYAGIGSNNVFTTCQRLNSGFSNNSIGTSITPYYQGSIGENMFFSRCIISSASQATICSITLTNTTYTSAFYLIIYVNDASTPASAIYTSSFIIPTSSTTISATATSTPSLISSIGTPQTNISTSISSLKYSLSSSVVSLLITDNVSTAINYGVSYRLACF
jgi:hypothetical protein